MTIAHNKNRQQLLVEIMLSNPEVFGKTKQFIKASYFDKSLQPTIKYMIDYHNRSNTVPLHREVELETGIQFEKLDAVGQSHRKQYVDSIVEFCRYQAVYEAHMKNTDHLIEGRLDLMVAEMERALSIRIDKPLGIDYFGTVAERLERIQNKPPVISSGWTTLDERTGGGFNRRELIIFGASSGHGKSVVMGNMAVNYTKMGLNVLYVSLEMYEDTMGMRLDAMITGIKTGELVNQIDQVVERVNQFAQGSGHLQIINVPSGITSSLLRDYIDDYEERYGIEIDVLILDYLDLMRPNDTRVGLDNVSLKDKYVSEELRNLASEYNMICITASQFNRGAVDEVDFDHSHIAGGLSKVQTCDALIGILNSEHHRARGEIQFQLMKTRNSSGFGSKITLAQNIDSMRIWDKPPEEHINTGNTISNSLALIDKLRNRS